MKVEVEYIDARTEARRTAVVEASSPDDPEILSLVKSQGRKVLKVLFTREYKGRLS